MSFTPSDKAIPLWNHLMSIYHATGRNEFNTEDYMNIPDHEAAIKELVAKGALVQANSILGELSLSTPFLKK